MQLDDEARMQIYEEEKTRVEARNKVEKNIKNKKQSQSCLGCLGLAVVFFILISVVGGGGEKESTSPMTIREEGNQEAVSEEDMQIIEYLTTALGHTANCSEAYRTISDLSSTWLYWTDEDVIKFAAATIVIENAYSSVNKLTPPSDLRGIHDKLLFGLKQGHDAMPILREGIDEMNADKISQASEVIASGTEPIAEATKMLNEYREKRGL